MDQSTIKMESATTTRIKHTLKNENHDSEATLPNGTPGTRAWMTVLGAWLVLFASMGNAYSFGVYQDFYTRIYLRDFSPSQLGWMASMLLMLPFLCGVVAGKLFDAGHFHQVVLTGSVILLFSLFMLSLAKEGQFYQVFLSHAVGLGLGSGLILTPTTGIVTLYFTGRRNLAYGATLSGMAIGGTVIPIVMNHLIPRIGFAMAVRADAYITLGCLVIGNCLMRLPLASKTPEKKKQLDIASFFSRRDPSYMIFIFGSILATFGLYFPLVYMQLYAIEHNVNKNLAIYSLAIINGSSAFGRIGINYFADMIGVWNLQVPVTVLTGVSIWTMLVIKGTGSLVAVSIFYGFFSGAWLSITLGGLATFASHPQEIGARMGVAMGIVAFSLLGSIPAQGAILTSKYLWSRAIAFSGSMLFAAVPMYIVTRMLMARKKGSQLV